MRVCGFLIEGLLNAYYNLYVSREIGFRGRGKKVMRLKYHLEEVCGWCAIVAFLALSLVAVTWLAILVSS